MNHLESLVENPETRELLTPTYTTDYKRLLVSNDYFMAFNRDDVTLEPSALASSRDQPSSPPTGRAMSQTPSFCAPDSQ
ncbi:hypothetical protein E5345_11295 [Propionibacterium sp. NM47_B9-13]|uniref:Uncharacterized protein n=2 Tax=Cutibacterium modestum TaxID=2559073 RepID=A0AAD1NWF7_9ACTN|nr:hypothetical protein HMPREF9621_00784 [Cutibacterium modestum HL037PA2]EFS93185.1 hypothetical protein HMPREF9607_00662 [Cutibacterium modestum HL044PA1]EFT15742.1 hypothetical protein HMPREF9622_01171 [Cutibacterium modestum HL037PA3]REB75094.1 hypothetical protein CP877_04655 [Cutibacterium modestum]TGY27570.1 hypothetical protein E5345_11295 [Propionibacterium sp. NM47_B9-13]